jgi:xylulokinase
MKDLVLAVDCSTTGVKCIVWDRQGTRVAYGRRELPLSIPQPGYGEQDSGDWWSASVEAIASALADVAVERIGAIAVTHQRESFVCLDAEGMQLRPAMLWLDSRAGSQVERFGSARIHDVTGKPPNPTPAFYKLMWLKEHEPEILRDVAHVVDVHGYLAHHLTGEWSTSVSSADSLGLIDLRTGQYSPEILEQVGLTTRQLSRVVPPGEQLGVLSAAAAAEIGLPSGIPIISGAGDGQSAGLGAGIISEGQAYLNLGTGLISGSVSHLYTPSLAYRAMAGTVPDTVNYELFVGAGTFMISWFLDTFTEAKSHLTSAQSGEAQALWEEQAALIKPGSEGLLVVPYWNGALTPYWDHNARGTMIGFSGVHTTAHVYRAILEGVAFELRLCLEKAEVELQEPMREFIAMGGGTHSELWCQMFADILKRPVVLAGEDEATCLGVGILAAAGSGMHSSIADAVEAMTSYGRRFEPDAVAAKKYDTLYSVYKTVYPSLVTVFNAMAETAKRQ